ncbi:MAG: hypothetical protein IJ111_04205 [Eggerthellaceae bacterium]|nr:hypothetical protein [Eggerthellaceae bacterium]
MKQSSKGKRTPLKAFAIILAVLVVVLYVTAGMRINDVSQGPRYDYDARDYQFSVSRNRFGMLYDTAIQDMNRQAEYTEQVEEYRALAFYYEQAVLEHAYRVAGDAEKADAFAERMGEYESQLGSMSDKTSAVREAIGS